MKKWREDFTRSSKAGVLTLGILLVLLIGYIDFLAGLEISTSILYLLPVSLVSWSAGRREGGLIALAGSLSWLAAGWYGGRGYSHPFIYYWNLAATFGFLFTVSFALSGFKKALAQEKQLARFDSLTEIANSRCFFDLAEKEIERCRRYKHPVTLVYIDCDNFKYLNDHFGHQIGNRLLHLLAANLRRNTRGSDVVARLGGDEFCILMPETGEPIVPLGIQKLHARLVDELREKGWPVTLSMGAAVFPDPPPSADEMVKSADRLMLLAKNEGKNTVRYKIFRDQESGVERPQSEPMLTDDRRQPTAAIT